MSDKFAERIKSLEKIMTDVQVLLSIVRDSNLQREAIFRLNEVIVILKDWKKEAISEKNEDRSNFILAMECFAKALGAELKMWLSLKAEDPEGAWD
jgi:hypothetical protein